jgi:hypothetical protein
MKFNLSTNVEEYSSLPLLLFWALSPLLLFFLQAHMQLSEFDQARYYLVRAGKLSPGNTEIRKELEKLNR